MSQPLYDDEFEQLFSRAQVDLPPHLKARLMTIPHLMPQPTFWDLRWIVPVASLTPAIFWLLITKLLPLMGIVTGGFVSWAKDLVLPVLPALSMPVIGICVSIFLASISFGIWIYWNSESRITLVYGRYLTGRL